MNDKFEYSYLVKNLIDFNHISMDDDAFKEQYKLELRKQHPTLDNTQIDLLNEQTKGFIKLLEPKIKELLNLGADTIFKGMLPEFQKVLNYTHLASTSFSESYDISPMWAHYGNNHNGVAIIFDHNHDYFNESYFNYGSCPTMYSDKPHKLNNLYYHLNNEGEEYCSFLLFMNKSNQWNYEREWRMLKRLDELEKKPLENSFIYLDSIPTEAIEGVIFGLGVDEQSKNKIKQLIKDSNPSAHIKAFNLKQIRETYGFELEEV